MTISKIEAAALADELIVLMRKLSGLMARKEFLALRLAGMQLIMALEAAGVRSKDPENEPLISRPAVAELVRRLKEAEHKCVDKEERISQLESEVRGLRAKLSEVERSVVATSLFEIAEPEEAEERRGLDAERATLERKRLKLEAEAAARAREAEAEKAAMEKMKAGIHNAAKQVRRKELALEQRTAALAKREEKLAERQTALEQKEKDIARREQELHRIKTITATIKRSLEKSTGAEVERARRALDVLSGLVDAIRSTR